MVGAVAMLLASAYAPLSASLSANSVSGSASGSSVSTNSVTAAPVGGSGNVSYAWELVSGSVSITSAATAATTFSASIGSPGGTASATARCKMTDLVTGEVAYTGNVSVYLERSQPALGANLSGSASITINSPTADAVFTPYVTITGQDGVPPYTYQFFKTGPSGDTCSVEVSGNQARFTNYVGPGQSFSPTAVCFVRDSIQQVVQVNFSGYLANVGTAAPPFSLSASPGSVGGFSNNFSVITDAATAVPAGAVGSVSYVWELISGVGSPESPSSASTRFQVVQDYQNSSGTFRCTATDGLGRTATTTVTATFSNFNIGPFN